jgi:uncharacterized protein YegP (UPF0339 family)
LQREAGLSAKGYSERDEKRILNALGRGLLKEFPNPDRIGCPGSDVLERIASHEMPLAEAEKWLDHLTSCSPCYSDFSQFQSVYKRQRTRTFLAIAASVFIVISLASWALFFKQKEPRVVQTAVLDLRNRSTPRGTEPNPGEQPLEVSRGVRHLNVYLPLGSAEGPYEMRIATTTGRAIFTTEGVASLKGGVTSIQTVVDLSSASSGQYIFQVRRANSEWNSYPLMLR